MSSCQTKSKVAQGGLCLFRHCRAFAGSACYVAEFAMEKDNAFVAPGLFDRTSSQAVCARLEPSSGLATSFACVETSRGEGRPGLYAVTVRVW